LSENATEALGHDEIDPVGFENPRSMFPRRTASKVGATDDYTLSGGIPLRIEPFELEIFEQVRFEGLFFDFCEIFSRYELICVDICSIEK
jgi:hypothetical protein